MSPAAKDIGPVPLGFAASRRLRRLFDKDRFAVWLCADVGLQIGPPGRTTRLSDLGSYLGLSFDAVVLSLAAIERFAGQLNSLDLRVVARVDWTNQWRSISPVSASAGATVASVASAAALGVDGIMHYTLLGHDDPRVEADYIHRSAQAVEAAHAVGLPCVLEPVIRGALVSGSERDATHQRWAIRTAVELGADAVKVEAPTDPGDVLSAADVPILVASTPPAGDAPAITRARSAREAGAAGVAYSSDIFTSTDPDALVRQLRATGE